MTYYANNDDARVLVTTLSDGSKVYDVEVLIDGRYAPFAAAINEARAVACADAVSAAKQIAYQLTR